MDFEAKTNGKDLTDIITTLKEKNATGALDCSWQDGLSKIWIKEGKIYFARSSFSTSLTDALTTLGFITEEALLHFRKQNMLSSLDDSSLDSILIAHKMVEPKYITYIRVYQIAETLYTILGMQNVNYAFNEGNPISIGEPALLPVNYDWIAELTEAVDKWDRIKEKLGSLKQVYSVNPYKNSQDVSPEEKRILNFIDSKRQLREIILKSGLKYFKAHYALLGLYEREIVTFAKRDKVRPSALNAKPIIEQLRVLFNSPGILNAFLVETNTNTVVQDEESGNKNEVITNMATMFSQIIIDFEKNVPTETFSKINQILLEEHNGEKLLLSIFGSLMLVTEADGTCDWGLLRLLSSRSLNTISQLITTY